ncbi:uncharacterized protein LOC113651470 isoform X2 [Tachysurus fulvidraco]|uniref:uncharacterized protein LOC113651470 isoform X2 n=1 Tax=Tachysurus fulvidraco TaxID=1234273 RepID=UPI001FEF4B15|nr:uncharacterized protein LOC113651470 isoform X2 [Tachysurus fulvidraco]
MSLLYISILWVCACVDSAEPNVTVSAQVGSTVILPCKLTEEFKPTSFIRWQFNKDTVFERRSDVTYSGSVYEGRVDVPVDELHKGNCSLVLKNVRFTDDHIYNSFTMVHGYTNAAEMKKITRVNLSVYALQKSAPVGSTAVLPCDWRNLSNKTPYVKWFIDSETVFERKGKDSYEGEGYEGRVDVPEDELLKGNCSLVMKNISVSDTGIYSSSMLITDTQESVLVQKVKLSVVALQISAPVGSTVILPCKLTEEFKLTSVIKWQINNEMVFKRNSDCTCTGKEYECRVYVPEDELRKGNCSLVLKDIRFTDGQTFTVEHADTNTGEAKEITRVNLSVYALQISAPVGSTVVLPCDWSHLSIKTIDVGWFIDSETVFERKGKDSYQGEGYEGRVDVPEDELLKGNCSLVMKNISVSDTGIYSSSMLITDTQEPVLVQKVKLSVVEDSVNERGSSSKCSDSHQTGGNNWII